MGQVGAPPETETAAWTLEEGPGLPLEPGSSERQPTSREVAAPADPPPTEILEWYIEGERTRTGKLRPPRYGILSCGVSI
jgi:hypothetical protein